MEGGAWELYLIPRLIAVLNGIWMYIIISAQNNSRVKHCTLINIVQFDLIFTEYILLLLLFLLNDRVNKHKMCFVTKLMLDFSQFCDFFCSLTPAVSVKLGQT